jgi:hypothetical protein
MDALACLDLPGAFISSHLRSLANMDFPRPILFSFLALNVVSRFDFHDFSDCK